MITTTNEAIAKIDDVNAKIDEIKKSIQLYLEETLRPGMYHLFYTRDLCDGSIHCTKSTKVTVLSVVHRNDVIECEVDIKGGEIFDIESTGVRKANYRWACFCIPTIANKSVNSNVKFESYDQDGAKRRHGMNKKSYNQQEENRKAEELRRAEVNKRLQEKDNLLEHQQDIAEYERLKRELGL